MSASPPPVAKPRPRLEGLNGEFHAHCARGELRFQACGDCGRLRHPPRMTCADCGSGRATWVRSSGRGEIFSWTVTHQALHPAFAEDVPYAVVVTELEEGVRLVSDTRDLPLDELALGLSVEVVLEESADGAVLPTVRPRRG